MRIVVVDDMVAFGQTVARALEDERHEVMSVLTPAALATLLPDEKFDLALVDLDFGYESAESGLTALRHLEEHGIRSVVYSSENEDNRVLFLLAAFQFFQPVALLPKRASDAEIRSLVEVLGRGLVPLSDPSARYRVRPNQPSPLDRLIGNRDELTMWTNLARYPVRADLARASSVSQRTLDKFLARRYEAMREIQASLLGVPDDPDDDGPDGAARKSKLLIRMHAFAVLHVRFFHDHEVRRLVEIRDGAGRRKR
jgi:CheY-like chemotaxis protein